MRSRLANRLAVGIFAAFLLGRLIILWGGKIFTSFDTFSYAYRNDPQWDRGSLVSFVGHAPRPWGAPIFFVLFDDDRSRAVGQWAIGTLAWALLAWSIYRLLYHQVAQLVALAGILVLGLTRAVANWDFVILSESLSISLGVLALALYLWWLRTKSSWVLVLMVPVAIWCTYTRVDMFVMVAPLCVALAWHAWRSRQNAKLRNQAVAASAVLAIAIGLSYAVIGPETLRYQQRWSFEPAMSHERGLLVYRLRISVFGDPEVKAIFEQKLGMPKCAAADEFSESGWAIDKFDAVIRTCPELEAWTEQNVNGLWGRYAAAAPTVFARQIGQLTSSSLSGSAYAQTPAVVPRVIEKASFPHKGTLLITFLALIVALGLAFAAGARKTHPRLLLIALVLAATALISAVLTVIVSSGEVWRFGIQEAIAIRVAIVMLLAAALDARLTSRR
jgi:4-amino-4-deoxy-L-arabinose transferase-like glycosyltransferase